MLLALLSGLIWAAVWGRLKGVSLIQPQTFKNILQAAPAPEPASATLVSGQSKTRVKTAGSKAAPSVPAEGIAAASEQAAVSGCSAPGACARGEGEPRRMLPSERWVSLFWMPSGNRARGP